MGMTSYQVNDYVLHSATKYLWRIGKKQEGIQKIYYMLPIGHKMPAYWAGHNNLDQHFVKMDNDKVKLFYVND